MVNNFPRNNSMQNNGGRVSASASASANIRIPAPGLPSDSNLSKAQLTPASGENPSIETIEFMFNPTELAFQGVVETSENPGSRSETTGKPKISFSNIKAYTVTISNIVFDTYETQEDVVQKHIEKFRKAVQFVSPDKARPPIYRFSWGTRDPYLKYCFIEQLSYKLTMFLPNGTPVRAVIDSLVLKETDGMPSEASTTPPPETNRIQEQERFSGNRNSAMI